MIGPENECMKILGLAQLTNNTPTACERLTEIALKKWMETAHPRQVPWGVKEIPGSTGAFQIGVGVRHKPQDLDEATGLLCDYLKQWMSGFFFGAANQTVYWRIPLEICVFNDARVIEYRADGPDVDPLTDRRCILDRSHNIVKAYFRVAVGDNAPPPLQASVETFSVGLVLES